MGNQKRKSKIPNGYSEGVNLRYQMGNQKPQIYDTKWVIRSRKSKIPNG